MSKILQDKTLNFYLPLVLVVFTFVPIIGILSSSPLNGEDFALTKYFSEDVSIAARFSWIIERIIEQASSWNARLGELFAIVFLSLPSFFLNIFLVFLLIFLAIFPLLITNTEINFRNFSFSLAFFYLLLPDYSLLFWKTVLAGYLLPISLSLLFVLYYSSVFISNNKRLNTLFYSVIAFFAGLSFENVPIALNIFAISVYFFKRKSDKKFSLLPLLFLNAGWLLLMFCPSTQYRINFYKLAYNFQGYNFSFIISRFFDVTYNFLSSSFLVLSILIFSFLIRCLFTKEIKINLNVLLFFISSVFVIPPLFLSQYTEPRAFLLFWIASITLCISNLLFIYKNKFLFLSSLVCLVVLSFLLGLKLNSLYSVFDDCMQSRYYDLLEDPANLNSNNIRICKEPKTSKYLNNRENWVEGNLEQFKNYFR